ncbi:MAG: TonB-dependent receptor [Gammaproteobacteria bacterium]|nr:TonB-dependent receptor [Gammaproteobacteria bacterium]
MSRNPQLRVRPVAVAVSLILCGSASASDAGQAAAKPSSDIPGLEEVIVTASKRAEKLQDVPVPVTVQTSEQLTAAGYAGIVDYANNVPSFTVVSYGTPGRTQVAVRGISSTGSIATVGTYLDDAPMGGSNGWVNAATTLLDIVPYDLEQVELLRGPQGTLYGQGAMGGILKYVLRKPSTEQFEGNVGGETTAIDDSDDLGYTVRGRVNMPVIDGLLGVSISGFDRHTPGYMDNEWTGAKDTNESRQYGGRVAALWTPSSDVSVNVTVLNQVIDAEDANSKQFSGYTMSSDPDGPLILVPTDPMPDSTQNNAVLASYTQHLTFLSTTVDWKAGRFDFLSTTSYLSTRSRSVQDSTYWLGISLPDYGGAEPGIAYSAVEFGVSKFNQEFRLASPQGDSVEWLVGLFYTHEEGTNVQSLNALNYDYEPVPPAPLDLYFASIPSVLDEYAVFGNVKWRLGDAVNVTVGARFSRNEQTFEDFIYPPGVFGLPAYATSELNQNVATWLASADYRFNDDVMAYVRAASGYRPGGVQAVSFAPSYDSDSLVNYELGLKSTFLDGRARVNLAAYHIDWKDIQLTAYTPEFVGYTVNGGKAVSQGFEIESEFTPFRGLTLGLNAGYTDAHLTSTVAGADYLLTGYQLPFAPETTASFTAEYDWAFAGGWTGYIGGAYRYTGAQYLALVNSASSSFSWPTVEAPSHTVVDLHAGIRGERWAVSLYANNVGNNRAISGANYLINDNYVLGTQQVSITELRPRTIAIGVDYSF